MPKSTQEQAVIIVGDDFTPGAQADAEIDALLGFNTVLLDDQAIRSDAEGCSIAPNYCGDLELVQDELAKFDLEPLILPSSDLSKRKRGQECAQKFIASFIYDDEHHFTVPQETEALALSCALWYVLAYHH